MSVRYNSDTDHIQAYYKDAWRDAIYAGLQGPIIPYMTSYNAPYGVVTASSSYGKEIAWHVFDGNINTGWRPNAGENIATSYIQYQFSIAHKINRVVVTSGPITVPQNCIGKSSVFVLRGSQDGKTWTDISGEYTIMGGSIQTITCYITDTVTPYLYFRLQFMSGNILYVSGVYGYGLYEVAVY